MDTVCDTLPAGLRVDLALGRIELAEARLAQRAKDTPIARARVADARARLDRILDRWLAVGLPA
jgi:hypothetical protein